MGTLTFLVGSTLGFFAAVVSWLFLGMPLLNAVGFYLASSLVLGALPLLGCLLRRRREDGLPLAAHH